MQNCESVLTITGITSAHLTECIGWRSKKGTLPGTVALGSQHP
jgi:hypothetical protein